MTASSASPDANSVSDAGAPTGTSSTPDSVPATAAPTEAASGASNGGKSGTLGVTYGSVVMEIGYDDDADAALSEAIEEAAGSAVVADDYDDVVDVVLLWWREADGDLVDALVDAIGVLADGGVVLLLTPKPGRTGHVESEDIADAAPSAGLQVTSTSNAAADWMATRLTAPRATSRTGKNLGAARDRDEDF